MSTERRGTVWIPESLLGWLRSRPLALVRAKERQGLERWEVDALSRPLGAVPAELQAPGSVPLGTLGAIDGPVEWVVTGVCLGTTTDDKRRWIRGGPTVEVVCGLDLAARIADFVGARLLVWIVDAEYANTTATGDAELDAAMGAAVEAFVYSRYPAAQVRRTLDPVVRGELYARVATPDFAFAYPRGVAAPNGVQRATLWQEAQYLACVGSMLVADGRSLVVVDCDQLRALAAAHALTGVAGLVYMPMPQLGWNGPPASDHVQWSAAALDAPRRMQRGPAHNRLHVGEAMPMPVGWVPAAAREVAWYLTGDSSWEERRDLPDLDECIRARRDQIAGPA